MLLRLAPWRRGPLLLLRRPGVALALTVAAFVATLPAAAAPLFLSSAQDATLHRQIAETCQWDTGVRFESWLYLGPWPGGAPAPDSAEVFERSNALVAGAAPSGLGPQLTTLLTKQVNAAPVDHPTSADRQAITLVAQDVENFADHMQVLDGPAGTGLWVPDSFARANQLKVGDRVRLTGRSDDSHLLGGQAPVQETASYETTVAAIFRDLRSLPDQPYWCNLRDVYRGKPGQELYGNEPILPMALMDTETFLAAGTAARFGLVGHGIEHAVADSTMDATEAIRLVAGIADMKERVYREGQSFESRLERHVRRAELVRQALLPPVLPITAAGIVVGLVVVAAAAVFWVQRRRQELNVLAAHGVGAAGLGLKAVIESLPAVLVGAAAGWLGAAALVRYVGPSAVLSPGAPPLAGLAAGATALVALVLIGAFAAGRARALTDQAPVTRRVRWWRRIPWELALLAAAPLAWVKMAGTATVDEVAGVGAVAHLPARLLVVPILVIAGVAMLTGRIVAGRLRARGLRRTPRRPTLLLGWRRMVRDATTTALLAGAAAVPIAMATYGATVTDSIRTTADAELRMLLGSDVVVTLQPGTAYSTLPADLAGRTTEVVRINKQTLNGVTVDVLAVDPQTATDGMYWDERIDGPTLADAAGQLSAGPVLRVVASGQVTPGAGTLQVRGQQLPVEVVDSRPLPGAQAGYPVVLVHRDAIDTDQPLTRSQLWMRGDPTELSHDVEAAHLPLARLDTVDDLRGNSVHEALTFTFQYLIALSIFTGLIAVVGLLLYLESRTVTYRRAYVLARRFGLRAGQHRRALLLELGAPVLAGLLTGLALAGGLVFVLRGSFYINKVRVPGVILAPPTVMIAVIMLMAAAVAAGAVAFAHRRVSKANPSEVLRDTP